MTARGRPTAVAGSWYPADERSLAAEVERHLGAARPRSPAAALVALISPHAGLRYSGPVAAWGYSLLRHAQPPETVVMVGPSHRVPFDGVSAWATGEWQTPLGPMPVAEDLARRLLAADARITDEAGVHLAEHSLEMQMPFLRHLLPGARILPLLMGSQTRGEVEMLAAALARVLAGHNVLLVASSDLSHYHPATEAAVLDAVVLEHVRRFDAEGLMAALEANHQHACGGGPMVAVMKAAAVLGADGASVLRYADSGDVEDGDKRRVVGYMSAALTRSAT